MPQPTRRSLILSGALLLVRCEALAAPRAELWPRWQQHNPSATTRIDHAAWGGFLRKYLRPGGDGINRIAYGAIGGADRDTLASYIDTLAATPINGFARPEQFAFWVNLYNAVTVRTVLAHYPVRSIRDINISPGLFAIGPWGKKLVEVEGEALSLDDIEHRILRPIWRDPRIHYAVNCAALGCPNLRPEPFTGANAEALLERAAPEYINHPRGAAVEGGGLVVSSIYDWYQIDFGGSERGVIDHLRHYARSPLAQALVGISAISATRYDWALNDAAATAANRRNGAAE